jgi:hypothetical protein
MLLLIYNRTWTNFEHFFVINYACFNYKCYMKHDILSMSVYAWVQLNNVWTLIDWFFLCLTPLSAIFQLYHGDQFKWWKKPKYPERTNDHGQATGKLYFVRLRVECNLFCNLQSRARTHAVLVIGLYELLGNPTT